MGADMIGYLVKGPRQIDDEQIAKASDQLWQIIKSGKQPCPHCGEENALRVKYCSGCDTELVELPKTKKAAYTYVQKLAKDWPPDYRDVSSRMDPDSDDELLVFAGDMSWGDTPDGEGYLYLKQILGLGIAEALGIR